MGPAADDSVWGVKGNPRGVSVDALRMDETEITNSKYKQFVLRVRDSTIRERLADPAFGGNEAFKIEEDKEGNPIKPYLNWNKPIPWRNANEDELRAIESVYRTNPITGKRELDPTQLNYRYEIYNHTAAAQRKNRLDPTRREYNTDLPVPTDLPVISKDTAYFSEDGEIIRETVSRQLTGDYDFLNTYIVNVYPDTTAWINDFGERLQRALHASVLLASRLQRLSSGGCELGAGQRILQLAHRLPAPVARTRRRDHRALPPAYRGRMGICGTRRQFRKLFPVGRDAPDG